MPPRRSNVRSEIAEQAEQEDQYRALDDQVRGSVNYWRHIVPAHVNAQQFAAIVVGQLHRKPDLYDAAVRNPQSLMAALADCARLGLVPGDGYALTFFNNKDTGMPDIVGMTEYTGELDLIFRTGKVVTVVAEVVFTEDVFNRGRHPHDPPVFEPRGGRFPGEEDRGTPEGGFCYAVFPDGSNSRIVYMARDEIMKHRAVAKTKKIWDGEFWRSMWLKTLVHELYKWVPKSPDYQGEMMRAEAAMVDTPMPVMTAPPPRSAVAAPDQAAIAPPQTSAPAPTREPGPGAEPDGPQDSPPAGPATPAAEQNPDAAGVAPEYDEPSPDDPAAPDPREQTASQTQINDLRAQLGSMGWSDGASRLRAVSMFLRQRVTSARQLAAVMTSHQADAMLAELRKIDADPQTASVVGLADAVDQWANAWEVADVESFASAWPRSEGDGQ